MAESKNGIFTDGISGEDIDNEALSSTQIEGVAGGSGASVPYSEKPCTNKRPERRPSVKSVSTRGSEAIFKSSEEPDGSDAI